MSILMDLLANQLGGDTVSSLSKQIGADERQTNQALSSAVPLLMSALARNASDPSGAESLYRALEQDHDGSILEDTPKFFRNPQAANGAGILRHVLGDQRGVVETGLAKQSGLDAGSAGQLLEMVAPMLMGALGLTQRQQHLDVTGLTQLLGTERKEAQRAAPDALSLLGGLLDANKDGSVLDDLGDIAGKLFGGRR